MRNIRHLFPPLNKLLSSLRIRSREFLRENTLHGFPYFVNPRRPLWERIFWFAATATSIGSAIGIIITLYQTFQREPTLTGLDTEVEDLVIYFPSLAVCSMTPTLNLGAYETNREHYENMYRWTWTPLDDKKPIQDLVDESYSQFFSRVTPDCDDLLENYTCGEQSVPCTSAFQKILVSRGFCCFAEGFEITKDYGPREISFDAKVYPLSIDFLEKNELPPTRRSPLGYVIQTGTRLRFSIEFTYSAPNVASLLRSQRKCSYPEEDLSYSSCMHKCQKLAYLKKCGCLPWYMMSVDGPKECTRSEYNCHASMGSDVKTDNCHCYLPCNHTTYKLDSINFVGKNNVHITLSDWPRVVYKRETRFGWLDLLVSFGGIAGLFVGYSLLTTVELAYYLSLRAYCGAVLAGSEKTIKIKVKKSKKTPRRRIINVVDLKKDYYNYVE